MTERRLGGSSVGRRPSSGWPRAGGRRRHRRVGAADAARRRVGGGSGRDAVDQRDPDDHPAAGRLEARREHRGRGRAADGRPRRVAGGRALRRAADGGGGAGGRGHAGGLLLAADRSGGVGIASRGGAGGPGGGAADGRLSWCSRWCPPTRFAPPPTARSSRCSCSRSPLRSRRAGSRARCATRWSRSSAPSTRPSRSCCAGSSRCSPYGVFALGLGLAIRVGVGIVGALAYYVVVSSVGARLFTAALYLVVFVGRAACRRAGSRGRPRRRRSWRSAPTRRWPRCRR